jgi:hypothetical protein
MVTLSPNMSQHTIEAENAEYNIVLELATPEK